jgi:hypothetical protein
MPTLGELLVSDGICSLRQIEDAVRNQVILGGLLGTNLVEMGFLSESLLARYLARQHNLPTLSGEDIQPDPQALGLLTASAVDRLNVIPFVVETKRLQVLCIDPTDLVALDEVAFITGLRPDPIVVPEVRFWQLLKRCYGIDRHLRYVALNTRDFIAGTFDQPRPKPKPSVQEDLIGEDDFAQLYQRRDGFPVIRGPQPGLPSEAMPLLDPADLEEISEPDSGQPPGGIDRRVWQSTDSDQGRRAEDHRLAERAGAPPSQPPRATADEAPLDFAQATELLTRVTDRHHVARVVLRHARSKSLRSMIFTIHRGVALGWDALGEGLEPLSFRSLMIPLDSPSVFQTAVKSRAAYIGALTKTRINIEFLRATGKQVPLSVVVIPVLVRGRVVNLLYVDNGHKAHSSSDIGDLLILTQHIARSYELLFEQKRAAFLSAQILEPPEG